MPSSINNNGLGAELFGGTIPDKIKIEHVLTLKFCSDKSEKVFRRWIDRWLDLSMYYAESFRFIAAGIGSYFFFLGVSKLLLARGNDNSCSPSSKAKTKIKSKDKDKNIAATGSSSSSRKVKLKRDNVLQLQRPSSPSSCDNDITSTNTEPTTDLAPSSDAKIGRAHV